MKKKQTMLAFLPKKEPLAPVQARIELSLVQQWERQLLSDRIGKADWIRAAIRRYLEESSRPRK